MDQIRKFGEQTSRNLEFKPEGLDFYERKSTRQCPAIINLVLHVCLSSDSDMGQAWSLTKFIVEKHFDVIELSVVRLNTCKYVSKNIIGQNLIKKHLCAGLYSVFQQG